MGREKALDRLKNPFWRIFLEEVTGLCNLTRHCVRIDRLPPAQDRGREYRVLHAPDEEHRHIAKQC